MDSHISELTMLLIYLNGWEEDSRRNVNKKVFRAWVFHKYEILDELENQGLIREIRGGKSLLVTEKGKKTALKLKEKWFNKTNEQLLKGLEVQPWTKSLLPCHISKDSKEFTKYLELMELMQMPEIEKMILEKLTELKIAAKDAIDKFFAGLRGEK
jgi:DNA-binding PadR family transcriptional regulator